MRNINCVHCGALVPPGMMHVCKTFTGYPAYTWNPAPTFTWNTSLPSSPGAALWYGAIQQERERLGLSEPTPEKRDMPVIGFRAWGTSATDANAYRVRLYSTGVLSYWEPGVNAARHANVASCTGSPPGYRCHCGFYVLSSIDEIGQHIGAVTDHTIIGAVLGWGKVVQHGNEGFRTQYARILALMDQKRSPKNEHWTQLAAQEYGVPVYGRAALERVVREYGDPLPKDDSEPA